jgi:hypothetical protein
MDLVNGESTQDVEVSDEGADQAPEVVSNDRSDETDQSREGEDDADGQSAESGAYQPNYKFNFYDKEGEIEEWARPFIKDKETEERFRMLYAKGHGFDVMKDKYKSKATSYGELETRYGELESKQSENDKAWDELRTLRDTDLRTFFDKTGLPIEKVIDFVQEHLDYLDLPPDQQKKIDAARETALKARALEGQVQSLSQQQEQAQLQAHVEEFQELMEHPEIDEVKTLFNQRVGQPEAFEKAVMEYGEAVFARTGKTLSPLEAIRAVYRQYKPFLRGEAGSQRPQQAKPVSRDADAYADAPPPQRRAEPKQVIPSLGRGSGNVSPTRRKFKSIEDLNNYAASLDAD